MERTSWRREGGFVIVGVGGGREGDGYGVEEVEERVDWVN